MGRLDRVVASRRKRLGRWWPAGASGLAIGLAGLTATWILVGSEPVRGTPPDRAPGAFRRAPSNLPGPRTTETRPDGMRVRAPNAEERERLILERLELAEDLRTRAEFGAASREYARALEVSREDERARRGLVECTELETYFAPIRYAFATADFRTALGLLYRIPDGLAPEAVRRATSNGWYDYGLVALRAGQCDDARDRFVEGMAVAPDPSVFSDVISLAEACRRRGTSVDQRAKAEARPFRGLAD